MVDSAIREYFSTRFKTQHAARNNNEALSSQMFTVLRKGRLLAGRPAGVVVENGSNRPLSDGTIDVERRDPTAASE